MGLTAPRVPLRTRIPRPGEGKLTDKLLRTKHEMSIGQDAKSASIKETHTRPSSVFHHGAKSETTHAVNPTTGKATTGTTFTRGSLTTTGRVTRNTGIGAGVVGGYGGLVHHDRKQKQKDLVAAARAVSKRDQKPLMSEAEQRRRQKLQGKIGRTTSALGLTGVALAGTGALAARKPGMLKNIPKLKNANPEKLKDAAFHTGIVSGGIGGVGGFNQASIYSAEARRRKAAPVKKDLGMDMGYVGDEGHAITHEEIEKAWEPTTRQYDPEAKRHKRAKHYETGLTAASSGAGAGAATAGGIAWHGHGKNQRAGRAIADQLGMKSTQIVPEAGRLKAVKRGKVAAGLAGASLAAGGGAALVHRQRKGSWKSYSKRDTQSAFGVAHDPNGQHRETEN